MSEWNYNLKEAPLYVDVLVTWVAQWPQGPERQVDEAYRNMDGTFERGSVGKFNNVLAWMPLPDPAPLPEAD